MPTNYAPSKFKEETSALHFVAVDLTHLCSWDNVPLLKAAMRYENMLRSGIDVKLAPVTDVRYCR